MPETETTNFGTISFARESVFEFPHGLPGFEERRKFLPVQNPLTAPILFLQSLEDPGLCFTTLPIWVVDPHYRLHITEPDLEILGFPADRQPRIGDEVLCLAVLSVRKTGTTANLLAPLVVNLKSYRAVQAVSPESGYSHQHPLFPQEVAAC
jgi:flagellar assembly factor FliW